MALRKAISVAPRNQRALQLLNITVPRALKSVLRGGDQKPVRNGMKWGRQKGEISLGKPHLFSVIGVITPFVTGAGAHLVGRLVFLCFVLTKGKNQASVRFVFWEVEIMGCNLWN